MKLECYELFLTFWLARVFGGLGSGFAVGYTFVLANVLGAEIGDDQFVLTWKKWKNCLNFPCESYKNG